MKAGKLTSMRGLLAGANLHAPAVQKPPKPAALPKVKLAQPKAAPSVKPAKQTQFRSTKSTDQAKRIKREQSSEYLRPNAQKSAGRINRILDIG
jgi:hypothetical protein